MLIGRSVGLDVPGSRQQLGSIRYTPHIPHRRRVRLNAVANDFASCSEIFTSRMQTSGCGPDQKKPSVRARSSRRSPRPRFRTFSDSLYARARVNVNLELSRSGKQCQERISATGWARGSGQFAVIGSRHALCGAQPGLMVHIRTLFDIVQPDTPSREQIKIKELRYVFSQTKSA